MKKILQFTLLICFSFLASQAMAQDKPTQNEPTYEQRDQPVTKDDLLILKRADEIRRTKPNGIEKMTALASQKIRYGVYSALYKKHR